MNNYDLIRDSDGNKMVLRPHAFNLADAESSDYIGGDMASYVAEESARNTANILGKLSQIGSAVRDPNLDPNVRENVIRDLNQLNETFKIAAGAESIDLSQDHLDSILGF